MPDNIGHWLLWLFIGAIIVRLTFGTVRLIRLRHAQHTHKDSNAPNGKKTDWKGFWGRR